MFGRAVVALLIQIGGLGVTSEGVGFILAAGKRVGFKGRLQNLIPYQSDVLLNLVTCGLIIFGGLGFLVILDVLKVRFPGQRRFDSQMLPCRLPYPLSAWNFWKDETADTIPFLHSAQQVV